MSYKQQVLELLNREREKRVLGLELYRRLCRHNSTESLNDDHAKDHKESIEELNNMIKWVGMQKE